MQLNEKFGLISLLLRYPEEELKNIVKSIDISEIDEDGLIEVLDYYKKEPLFEIQKEYVKSFDMNERSSLYLTYHKFKDDPKRGNYLARLVEYYREKGFEFVDNELPDFLPIILEFVSYIDEETGIKVLQAFSKELNQIYKGLLEVDSKFTPLIDFILKNIEIMEVKQND